MLPNITVVEVVVAVVVVVVVVMIKSVYNIAIASYELAEQ